MAFICINNGYYNTKVLYQGKQHIFKSAIRKSNMETDDNLVTINGINYVVGEGSDDINLNKNSSLVQQCCVKHALSYADGPVNVVSAMPVNSYLNKQAREDYKRLFLINGALGCTVYMEGMSAVLSDYNWYVNQGLVCLIDIGGLTINAMLVDRGKLVPNTAFSINLGTIILNSRIKKAIEQQCLINVPEYQIKYFADSEEAKETVNDFFKEIKNKLNKMQYPSNVLYRFTGGGSIDYRETIAKHFKNAYTSNNAIYENVLGLQKVGEMIYG